MPAGGRKTVPVRVTPVASQDAWQTQPGGEVVPFVAAGDLVLIVSAGHGWVANADGERVPVTAPAVVSWESGERVHYGSETDHGWSVQDYWGPRTRGDGFHPCD